MSGPCRRHKQQLVRLMAGALPARSASALELHLAACPACAAAYRRLQQVAQLCQDLGREPPPQLPWRQLEAQVRWRLAQQRSAPGEQPPRGRRWRWGLGLTVVATAAIAGTIIGGLLGSRGAEPPPPAQPTAVAVPAPAPVDEELAAMVTLVQGQAQVVSTQGKELPVELTRPLLQGDRVVTAKGQVAFQWLERSGALVAEQTHVQLLQLRALRQELVLHQGRLLLQLKQLQGEQRFNVVGGGLRATVHGTFFSFALTERYTEVAVFEGSVQVEPLDSSWPAVEVPAGQVLQVPLAGATAPPLPETGSTPPSASLLNLQPWPSLQRVMASTGVLAIESLPRGLDVRLDALPVGRTNLRLRGSFGPHAIELWRNGELLRKQWVEIQPNQEQLRFDLRARRTRDPKMPAAYQDVFRHRAVQIRACYERLLKRDPTLAGRLTVQVTIDAQGQVGEVALLQDSFADPGIGRCAVNAIRRWAFPPGQATELVYPFVLRPQK